MKKMLTQNLGLKLVAVICAVLLWLVVVNVNNPVSSGQYTVPVTFENVTTVTDAGMVYSVMDDTDTVTVTVKAQRSVLSELEASDLVVVADFNNITQMNTIPLEVTTKKYSSKIERMTLNHSNLKVSLEEGMTKEFGVEVEVTGTPKEGYAVGDMMATPNIVTVTGPASVVEQIATVRTKVSVDNRNTTIRTSSGAIAVDAAGKEIKDDRLSFSQKDILTNVSFLQTKSVNLKITTTGECAKGYRLVETDSAPTTVTIAGKAEALAQIDTIDLPGELLDISGATEDVTAAVDVSGYLPDGVRIPTGAQAQVELTAKIEKLETVEVTIPTSEVNLMNTPVNMFADFGGLDSIKVVLNGTKEDLDALDADDVSVSVDLDGLLEGVHRVEVIVTAPDNINAEGETWVDVYLESTVIEIPYDEGF